MPWLQRGLQSHRGERQQSQSLAFVLEELAALLIHMPSAGEQLRRASAAREGDAPHIHAPHPQICQNVSMQLIVGCCHP